MLAIVVSLYNLPLFLVNDDVLLRCLLASDFLPLLGFVGFF